MFLLPGGELPSGVHGLHPFLGFFLLPISFSTGLPFTPITIATIFKAELVLRDLNIDCKHKGGKEDILLTRKERILKEDVCIGFLKDSYTPP